MYISNKQIFRYFSMCFISYETHHSPSPHSPLSLPPLTTLPPPIHHSYFPTHHSPSPNHHPLSPHPPPSLPSLITLPPPLTTLTPPTHHPPSLPPLTTLTPPTHHSHSPHSPLSLCASLCRSGSQVRQSGPGSDSRTSKKSLTLMR